MSLQLAADGQRKALREAGARGHGRLQRLLPTPTASLPSAATRSVNARGHEMKRLGRDRPRAERLQDPLAEVDVAATVAADVEDQAVLAAGSGGCGRTPSTARRVDRLLVLAARTSRAGRSRTSRTAWCTGPKRGIDVGQRCSRGCGRPPPAPRAAAVCRAGGMAIPSLSGLRIEERLARRGGAARS